jgi:hypothetical protein
MGTSNIRRLAEVIVLVVAVGWGQQAHAQHLNWTAGQEQPGSSYDTISPHSDESGQPANGSGDQDAPTLSTNPPLQGPRPFAPPKYSYESSPEYLSAIRGRTAGLLVATIGGGAGLVTATMGLSLSGHCGGFRIWPCSQHWKTVSAVGFSVMAVSLAVGIPLLVDGAKRVNRIRKKYANHLPEVSIALEQRGGGARLQWSF